MPPISVPQPKTFGPLGNLPQLNFEEPVQSLVKLAEEYGPIFRMEYPGRSELYISGHELVAEVTDESKFDKRVWAPLRRFVHLQEMDYLRVGPMSRIGKKPITYCCQVSVNVPCRDITTK